MGPVTVGAVAVMVLCVVLFATLSVVGMLDPHTRQD
jgi:hypothetical protein